MYAAKWQEIDDPYRGLAIWTSNSLDETASQFCIRDRGVDFWGPKSRIYECMQRNRHLFWNLVNVSHNHRFYSNFIDSQASTSMEDPWFSHSLHEPVRILDRSVDFWSPKIEFSNVCSDIIIFSQNWYMYYGKSTFFKIIHLFSSLISPRIGFLALKWRRHQGVRSPPNPLSDRRKSLPDDPDIAPHGLRYAHLASPWLAERL